MGRVGKKGLRRWCREMICLGEELEVEGDGGGGSGVWVERYGRGCWESRNSFKLGSRDFVGSLSLFLL